jgi:hypothetical protein
MDRRVVFDAYKNFISLILFETRQQFVLFSFGFVFFFCALQKRKGMKRKTMPRIKEEEILKNKFIL